MPTILIADDHPLFREALKHAVARLLPDATLHEADSADALYALVDANADADLLLLDLNMPGVQGYSALVHLRGLHPQLPVVMVSAREEPDTMRRALDHGAMGFIPKSASSQQMFEALRTVLAHGIHIPPLSLAGIALTVPAQPRTSPAELGLTPRQTQVLRLILEGKPMKLIARELGLSHNTAKTHVSAVLRALCVTTRTQAIVAASRMGLVLGRDDS